MAARGAPLVNAENTPGFFDTLGVAEELQRDGAELFFQHDLETAYLVSIESRFDVLFGLGDRRLFKGVGLESHFESNHSPG